MLIINFMTASLFGFLGSLQPGSVNTFVINETITSSKLKAFHIALGGSLIQGLGAIIVVSGIGKNFQIPENAFLIFALASIGLGGYYLSKNKIKTNTKQSESIHSIGIIKGISLALINPQIIPFWALIWITFGISTHSMSHFNALFFGLGAFIGTLSNLLALIFISDKLIKVNLSMINKITGATLIIIGAIIFIRWL